uniref:Ion_trans_2 domain-containing protein n=1 Tax=Meloidogyne hapla TaxID=6305 RepID=A0A1I8BXH7_MELHA
MEGVVLYEEPEPLYIILIPHLAMIASLIAYMIVGSLIYRIIDQGIGNKSWARSFIWVFQLLATIGWGDSQAGNTQSQAFTEQNADEVLDVLKTQRLPLASILTLLILHQCLGVAIYSFGIKDWPIVSTTLIAILYISAGIILLSALFLTLALYYQAFLYIELKGNFVQVYEKFLLWKSCNKVRDNTTVEKGVTKN